MYWSIYANYLLCKCKDTTFEAYRDERKNFFNTYCKKGYSDCKKDKSSNREEDNERRQRKRAKRKSKNKSRLSTERRDSNPRNALDVYTLSRRASSTTRASFPFVFECHFAIATAKVLLLSQTANETQELLRLFKILNTLVRFQTATMLSFCHQHTANGRTPKSFSTF